jgi:hypothetical protein
MAAIVCNLIFRGNRLPCLCGGIEAKGVGSAFDL